MTSFTHTFRNNPLVRQIAVNALVLLIITLTCAILVTYTMHVGSSFSMNIVFSGFIGGAVMLTIQGGRHLFWRNSKPTGLAFIALVVVSVPIGYGIGVLLAVKAMGYPISAALGNFTLEARGIWIITLAASAVITWYFWNRDRVSTLSAQAEAEKARAAAIEKQAMQAQLQMLQAQIEPHMLFNTLANLQGLIAIDAPRAQHMLDQLIQYLRATLTASRAQATTLAQEFTLLEAYLGLMSVRMGARLSYTLQLPDDLRDVHIPPMLLQPLIENAIQHGLEPKIDGGHVEVAATRHGNQLSLTVTDTGLGIDGDGIALQSHAGNRIGSANIRERLQLLYGNAATFSLNPNTPTGAIAHLTLPLSS